MKHAAAICFALTLCAIGLAAQARAQAIDQYHPRSFGTAGMEGLGNDGTQNANARHFTVLQLAPAQASACPVPMRAQQGASGGLVAVRRGQATPPAPAFRLTLTLTNPKSTGIASARVTVHGLSGKTRAIPTDSAPESDLARTMNIRFDDSANAETADLLLRGFTTVTRIDLDSLTYADGATWTASAGASCHVAPDPLMLLSAR
jgi:hypothetical protein